MGRDIGSESEGTALGTSTERTRYDALTSRFREAEARQLSLLGMSAAVLRERRVVAAVTAIGILVSLLISIIRPPSYTTSFSFVAQDGSGAGRSGLASLAGQFGVSLGASNQSQSPQFYADLLETRAILSVVARDSFTAGNPESPKRAISDVLGVTGSDPQIVLDETVRALREKVIRSTVAARTTGVVSVTTRTESPEASLEIASRLVAELNRFNVETRQSQASQERKFVEARLASAQASLRAGENTLQAFLESNRQTTNSPELSLQRGRLERELMTRQQLVADLSRQYEEARIREVRDTPVLTLVESPVIAARPDPRGRVAALAAGASVGLLLAISFVLARESLRHLTGSDPAAADLASEWRELRGTRPH